jgi:hypothetical protein
LQNFDILGMVIFRCKKTCEISTESYVLCCFELEKEPIFRICAIRMDSTGWRFRTVIGVYIPITNQQSDCFRFSLQFLEPLLSQYYWWKNHFYIYWNKFFIELWSHQVKISFFKIVKIQISTVNFSDVVRPRKWLNLAYHCLGGF